MSAARLLLCACGVAAAQIRPRPIGANVQYMEHLAAAGLIERGPQRGPPMASALPRAAADPWFTAKLKGVAYIPSVAKNQMEQWHDYDAALVRKELAFASAAAANAVRVSLHWALWFAEPTVFLANVEDFVTAASDARLKVVFALFDGTGADLGGDAVNTLVSGAYKKLDWFSNPGQSQLSNQTLLPILDSFVKALVSTYGSDPRVVGWDAFYQPILCAPCATYNFLERVLGLLAGVDASNAWVTVSVIPGAEACDSKNLPATGRSVVSFENYNGNRGERGKHTTLRCNESITSRSHFVSASKWGYSAFIVYLSDVPVTFKLDCRSKTLNRPTTPTPPPAASPRQLYAGAVGGDTIGVQQCAASLNPAGPALPVILSGSMGRWENPPSGLCEIVFEAYGTAWMDVPAHPQIGFIIPFLMIGIDQFTRDASQGLVWAINGSWFSAEELACFSAAVPPFPPPPPPPPPPAVNFTTPDGLLVGLRSTTRAVQLLGLHNDSRWFGNFSFVPPLWSFIPEKPHRDFGGNHHLGDLVVRCQPASETNASSWSFYSSALGADDVPAVPLPITRSGVYDFSNITAATSAGGQLDTRYPLGLEVYRSVEVAPGGRPGFAIRWNLTVPVSGAAVRIGGLGFPLISDTFFGGLNNTQIIAGGSFLDVHVGAGHGFATFTRADGSATLVVAPCSADAGGANARLEAWRPVLEDATAPNEGMWEWTVHSAAWAAEWAVNKQAPQLEFPTDPTYQKAWPEPKSPWPSWHLNQTVWRPNPRPWNEPTSVVLQPGQSVDYALCFSLAPAKADPEGLGGPRARDAGLEAAGRAVLIGVPGYVVTSDMASAALYVRPPDGATLTSATTDDPAILSVGAPAALPSSSDGFLRIPVAGQAGQRGPARLVLHFSDGSDASVHYYVLPPLLELSSLYGSFAASTAWLPRDFPDAFGRSASFMPWDREDGVHVLQDARPFVVGLSDDAGAGYNLGMASKLAAGPHAGQLALLDEYVNATLLGIKTDTAQAPFFSLQDPDTWRIYMTLFYFDRSPENTTGYYTETDKCNISPSWCAFNSPWCNPDWCALPPAAGGWAPATYRQYK